MYIARSALGATGSPPPPFEAGVERWRSRISAAAGDLPVDFLLAWIQRESGGNPCSYTSLRESGIFQLMPPDNTNTGGTTEAALRPACSGQSATRSFTNAELDEQVRSGLRYVRAKRDDARRKLAKTGVSWSESSPDFWSVVKLQHAYPAPTETWLMTARAQLGRAPASWAEMRAANPGARADVLNNAEWVGQFGAGGGSSGSGIKFLIILGTLGALAAMTLRHPR